MRKKLLVTLLTICMLTSLCACGKKDNKPAEETKVTETNSVDATTEEVNQDGDNLTTESEKVETEEVKEETEETKEETAEITDEELIETLINGLDEIKSAKFDMHLNISAYSELTEETRQSYVDMGINPDEIDLSTTVNVNQESFITETAAYSVGKCYMNMMGMELDIPTETYVDITNLITYSKETNYEVNGDETVEIQKWYKKETQDNDILLNISDIAKTVEEITVNEVTDDSYILKGVTSINDTVINENALGNEIASNNEDKITVLLTFNKETKYLTKIEYDLTEIAKEEQEALEDTVYDVFEFYMTLSEYNNVTVEIPEDVIESAEVKD